VGLKIIYSLSKNKEILTDIFKSGVLVLEVATDLNVIVSDSSPNETALVASRSGGLVQAENKGPIQIRLHVIVNSNRARKALREIVIMNKVTQ